MKSFIPNIKSDLVSVELNDESGLPISVKDLAAGEEIEVCVEVAADE